MASTVTPSELAQELVINFALKIPTLILGKPGIGKTAIVDQVIAEQNLNKKEAKLNLMESVDVKGLPYLIDTELGKQTAWSVPDFLPQQSLDGEFGVIVWEEIMQASKMTQTSTFGIIQEGRKDNWVMPDGWTHVATGNRAEDKSATNEMPAALKSRFATLHLEESIPDWKKYHYSVGGDPDIAAFIDFMPQYFCEFNPKLNSWPSPRTWSNLSKRLQKSIDVTRQLAVVSGYVGEEAAAKFIAFQQLKNAAPTIAEIEADPFSCRIPNDVGTQYAVVSTLVQHTTPVNFQKLIQYSDRYPKELQVSYIRDVVQRYPELISSPTFNAWIKDPKNQNII